MTSATYTVEIDSDRDQTYGTDLTSRVLGMAWNNGLGGAYDEFAKPSALRLDLDNADGALNPEASGAALYGLVDRDMLVRVRATFSATTYTLWQGKVREVALTPGVLGPARVVLACSDLMSELLQAEYNAPLLQNVTTGEAIGRLFDDGVVALPYADAYWVLGVAGASELGTTTILLDRTGMTALDTGGTTLAYTGDVTRDAGMSAQGYLRELVAAECGGRFFYDARTGLFTFQGRYADVNKSAAETLTGADLEAADYRFGADVVNRVTVHYTPRQMGAANSVLWTSTTNINLAPGESRVLSARYKDPAQDAASVGGIDFAQLVAGLDYTASSSAEGGDDRTTDLLCTVNFGGARAEVFVINRGATPLVVTHLQVRGTPLYSDRRESVEAYDAASAARYGQLPRTIQLSLVDNRELAENYAASIIGRFSAPFGRLASVNFIANKDDARMARALARTVGDLVRIDLSALNGHDGTYVIVGERHDVRPGGEGTHRVTWTLKPADSTSYWFLGATGYSELGTTTILAF